MIQTTPVQERYTRFSCPNPQCARFNHPGEGNIVHRSWTGTHKHIDRLRCTACDREFSEREGTEAKDAAMRDWCARVTQQTGQQWEYARINQSDFEARVPRTLAEAIQALTLLQG